MNLRRACATAVAVALTTVAIVAVAGPAAADGSPCTIFWTGAVSTDWLVADNWSATDGGAAAGRTPAATDVVCMSTAPTEPEAVLGSGSATVERIDFGKTAAVIPSLTVSAAALTVGATTASTIEDLGLESTGSFGGVAAVDNFVANGTPSLTMPGVLEMNGTSRLDGSLTIASGYTVINTGSFSACGALTGTSGAPEGRFENAGTMTVPTGQCHAGISHVDVVNDAGATMGLRAPGTPAGIGYYYYRVDQLTNRGQLNVLSNGVGGYSYVQGTIYSTGKVNLPPDTILSLTAGEFDLSPGSVTNSENGALSIDGGTLRGLGGTVPIFVMTTGVVTGTVISKYTVLEDFDSAPLPQLVGPGSLTMLNGNTEAEVFGANLSDGFRLINQRLGAEVCGLSLTGGSVYDNQGISVGSYCPGGATMTGDGTGGVVNEPSGQLTLQCGAVGTPLTNYGTLHVGCRTDLSALSNIANGTLTGGEYALRIKLTVPDPVTTNAATVEIGTSAAGLVLPDGTDAMAGLTRNTGSLAIYGNRTFTNALTNSGAVRVASGVTQASGYTQTDGATRVDPKATLRSGTFGDQPVEIGGGTLSGQGTVLGALTVGGGTLVASPTAKPLTLGGSAVLSSASTTRFAPTAATPSGSALIEDAGPVALGGTLAIVPPATFAPAVGTTYTLLHGAAGISGRFAHLIGADLGNGTHLVVGYTSDTVTLEVASGAALSIASTSIDEHDSGVRTLRVPVRLSVAASRPITVHYATADGTATAGSDYVATSGTLTIPAGATSRTIAVSIRGDTTAEPDETFSITLSNPAGAALGTDVGVETIRDDDARPPTVGSISPAVIGQNATTMTVTVTGTGFASGALVGFGTTDLTVVTQAVQSSTTIVATISSSNTATPGPRDVRVRNPGVSAAVGVCSACFTVTAKPAPKSMSRSLAVGAENRSVVLTGTSFEPGAQATITGAHGSVTVTSTTYVSSTQLHVAVTIPRTAQPGAYAVRVRNADGGYGGCTGCFTVVAGPTIDAITPSTVGSGESTDVTITGSGFLAGLTLTGPAGVAFDDVTVVDSSTVTARADVSASAVIGANQPVEITNPNAAGYGSAILAGLTII